jgi:hypothetical protein
MQEDTRYGQLNIRYAFWPVQIARFLSLLPTAVRETWYESHGRMCSRACTDHHQYDRYCLLGTSIKPWGGHEFLRGEGKVSD